MLLLLVLLVGGEARAAPPALLPELPMEEAEAVEEEEEGAAAEGGALFLHGPLRPRPEGDVPGRVAEVLCLPRLEGQCTLHLVALSRLRRVRLAPVISEPRP